MMRDEALEELLGHLDRDSFGTLRIHADYGEYRASYATGVMPVQGEWQPVLSDALVSLVEKLRA